MSPHADRRARRCALNLGLALIATGLTSCDESESSNEVENATMTAADDTEAYVRKYLNGTGVFRHLVISDRLFGRTETKSTLEGAPSLGVDALAGSYLASRLSPRVVFERQRSLPPPTEGYPAQGGVGVRMPFPEGTGYILIYNVKLKRRPKSNIVDLVPAVALYGDAAAIGAHSVDLTEPAPGDKPCREYCTSTEEAFQSIRGRLDLIIRNVGKEA